MRTDRERRMARERAQLANVERAQPIEAGRGPTDRGAEAREHRLDLLRAPAPEQRVEVPVRVSAAPRFVEANTHGPSADRDQCPPGHGVVEHHGREAILPRRVRGLHPSGNDEERGRRAGVGEDRRRILRDPGVPVVERDGRPRRGARLEQIFERNDVDARFQRGEMAARFRGDTDRPCGSGWWRPTR